MCYFVVTSILVAFTKWHWPLTLNSIINYNLYFLIFLLSFTIYKNSQYNRYIFLNISIWAIIYALSFFHIFVGDNYLFGDNYWEYRIFQYRKFLISTITCITVVYLSIDYLFYTEQIIKKYFKTLLIVLPVNFGFYYNYLIDKNYIFVENHFNELFRCAIETKFLALFFIGLYGYLFYKKEKPIGHFINSIVAIFFIFIVYDIVDGVITYYHINVPLPKISYLILTFILIYLIILLMRKLRYTNSNFGEFYERFIFSDIKIDLKVKKKKYYYFLLIEKIQNYLSIFPNKFFSILLMIISIVLFIIFFPTGYGKQIVISLGVTALILIIYINALLNKQNNLWYN